MFVLLATLLLCLPAVTGQSTCQCKFPDQMSGFVGLTFSIGSSSLIVHLNFAVNYELARVHLWASPQSFGTVNESLIDMATGKIYVWAKQGNCSVIDAGGVTFPSCVPLAKTRIVKSPLGRKQFYQQTINGFSMSGSFHGALTGNRCIPEDVHVSPESFSNVQDTRHWTFKYALEDKDEGTSKFFPNTDKCVKAKSFNFLVFLLNP